MKEGRKGGKKKKPRKGKESLQHDVMPAAFRSPNTEQKQTTWAPDLLSWRVCVLSSSEQPAPAGKSTRPDRQVLLLTAPGPDQTSPPARGGGGSRATPPKKKKKPGGNKDRLTHTHTQASVSTNLEAIRNGSRVQCGGTHSFMHWAVGGGERGP